MGSFATLMLIPKHTHTLCWEAIYNETRTGKANYKHYRHLWVSRHPESSRGGDIFCIDDHFLLHWNIKTIRHCHIPVDIIIIALSGLMANTSLTPNLIFACRLRSTHFPFSSQLMELSKMLFWHTQAWQFSGFWVPNMGNFYILFPG